MPSALAEKRSTTVALPVLLPVVGSGLPVPLVHGGTAPYANFDYAASAPALTAVADHVSRILPYYSSVHRGAGFASQVSTSVYEAARGSVSAFVDARDEDVVVFTRNTTDSLNLLARCVPEGGGVLFLDVEHHANLLPWRGGKHCWLPAAKTLEETLRRLSAQLARDPVALVAVTGASNVTGEILPIAEITAIAHGYGARVVVDAAQLAPHRRVSLRQTGIDYLAFSGHKLYAPFGAGVLVGRRDWLDDAPPYLAGGGAVREVSATGTTWAAAPQRHEAGTPNVLGAASLAKACDLLAALPADTLEQHEEALRRQLLDGLSRFPEVRPLRIWPDATTSIGVVSFTVDGHDAGRLAARLSAECGVGVRDGRFCAHPLLTKLGAGKDGAVRVSFGVGTSSADVERLLAALEHCLSEDGVWDYEVQENRWTPVPDPRVLPDWLAVTTAGASPCEETVAG